MFNSPKRIIRIILVCSAMIFAALIFSLTQWRGLKPAAAAPVMTADSHAMTAAHSGGNTFNARLSTDRALMMGARVAIPISGPVVANTSDSGPGSLRDAIVSAAAGDTITFAVTGTITLASELAVNKNLTIQGPGANVLTISGNNTVGVFNIGSVTPGINVTLSGLTIANGRAVGGGIYNQGTTTLTNCIVTNNTAELGGGIYNSGTMTLHSSTVSGNSATGVYWFTPGGGGIFNYISGTMTLTKSTVSGNTAGSGIVNLNGNLTIENSTVSGNRSFTGYGGGGILNFSVSHWGGFGKATTIVINSTIAENRADSSPGFRGRGDAIADAFSPTGSVTVKNSILASPSQGLGNDCYGSALTSLGYNIASDNSCGLSGIGDMNNTNPLLGLLANNGGPTQTHALLPGSPAIDKGSAAISPIDNVTPITTDQRGLARPVDLPSIANATGGNGSDIGALEDQTPPNTAPTIAASGPFTRAQGSPAGAAVQIATVGDNETLAGSLTVTATSIPADITLGLINNADGAITTTIAANCNATLGDNTVTLEVSDGDLMATATLHVTVIADATPPVISCPASIIVNGNSSGGAIVSFSVAATDNCDPSPGVSVTKSSGSLFLFGATTVTATATDASGNFSQCSFNVTVRTQQQQANSIISQVQALITGGTLTQNQGDGLIDKLNQIITKLNQGQANAACNQLNAFINQVNGFINSGSLTSAQGQSLINAANVLQTNIGC